MTFEKKVIELGKLVLRKLDGSTSVVHYTGHKALTDGQDFIFVVDFERRWTVYQGCELLVGDTTLGTCCRSVLFAII